MLATWFEGFEADEMSSPELKSSGQFAEMMVRRERDAQHLLERAMPDCELSRNGFESLLVAGRYGSPSVRVRARAYEMRFAEATLVSGEVARARALRCTHCKRNEAAALLSACEREIAMLAVQSQSNMEIARELSITRKTEEKHLGSGFLER